MTATRTAPETEPKVAASITPKDLITFLITMLVANQPTMIWGQPGVGKSDAATLVGRILEYIYHDIRPLTMERIDLLGIPFVEVIEDTNITRWAHPGLLPRQNSNAKHLINIEEITSAKNDMQSSLFQLVLNRACGEYKLPEGARIIACGNRVNDRGVVYKMPTPLASRFLHVELVPSVSDWVEWALDNDIDPDVIFFIRFIDQSALNRFDPKSSEAAYPCPRTWEQVSRVKPHVQNLPPDLQRTAYIGSVGEAIGSDFYSFLDVKDDIPDIRHIMTDPTTARIPPQPSTQVLLCSSLLRKINHKNFHSVCQYALRLEPEYGHFMIGEALRQDPELVGTEAHAMWAAKAKGP